jgi:hypothetical protein
VRLLVLYLRSRRAPAALACSVGVVAGLWVVSQAIDDPDATRTLGLLAVVAGTVATGSGLAGADIDLDRTAAIAWPPRRAGHVLGIGGVVLGIVAAASLTGHQLASAAQATRDAVGIGGLLALGAVALGANLAWVVPTTWTLLGVTVLPWHWQQSAEFTYQQVLTWMVQPPNTTPATSTALILGATGVLAYAILGPRR